MSKRDADTDSIEQGENELVNLAHELEQIRAGLLGMRILSENLLHGAGVIANEETAAPAAISALLSFMAARVDLIERCARGTIDPQLVLTPQNTWASDGDEEHPDEILIKPWTDQQIADRAQEEMERARHRVQLRRSANRGGRR